MDVRIARWRLRSQRLSAPHAAAAVDVVRTLLCVQAENPGQSAWAVAARTTTADPADLASLLASGAVLRTHVLRPTWHYVRREDLDWLLVLTAPRVLPVADRQLVGDLGWRGAELDRLGAAVLDALGAGPLTRTGVAEALGEREPALARRLTGQSLMLLMARLELERLVCSGPPDDGEHTYAAWESRVGERTEPGALDRDDLLARVALGYLEGHGPATVKDLAYWATLPVGEARRGVEAVRERLASFEHDGRVYWHLAEHGPPSEDVVEPRAHLLQVLDETYRGYQDSRWVLDAEGVVPRTRETAIGMAVVDGQVVAGMKRTLGRGTVRFDVLPHRPLTPEELAEVERAAERYGAFLGLEPVVAVRR